MSAFSAFSVVSSRFRRGFCFNCIPVLCPLLHASACAFSCFVCVSVRFGSFSCVTLSCFLSPMLACFAEGCTGCHWLSVYPVVTQPHFVLSSRVQWRSPCSVPSVLKSFGFTFCAMAIRVLSLFVQLNSLHVFRCFACFMQRYSCAMLFPCVPTLVTFVQEVTGVGARTVARGYDRGQAVIALRWCGQSEL